MPPKRRSSRQAAKKKQKEQEQQQAQQQQQQKKKEQKKEQEEVQVVEDKEVPLVAPETPDDPRVPVLSVLHGAVHLLWRGVRQRDNLVLRRALRRATGQRSKLGSEVLSHLVSNVLEDGDAVRSDLLVRLESEAYDAVDVSEIRALLPEGGALPSMVDLSVAAAMRMREEVEKEVERKKQEKIKAQKAKEEAAEAKDGNKSAAAKKKKKKEEEEAAAAAKKKEADSEGADAAKDDDGDVVMSAEDAAALAKQKAEEAAAAARAEAAEGVDPEQEIARDDVIHETHFFFKLLVVMFLLDRKKPAAALALCQGMVQQIPTLNRRSLDVLSAKVYFYFALAHELEGTLGETRPALLEAHRTACLHHDEPSQIALTNALLRSLVRDKLIRQADKFRLHTRLPGNVPSPQMARYLFYKGVINAVQLHYSEAFDDLTQAVRKAPRKGAVGFRQLVTKNLIVVQLLMGDIPERSVFRQADLERSLRPYFQITRAVREGNLQLFSQATEKFGSNFRADQTLTLINRLRHNVIKTGLRNINVSYSRISLADVCKRLKLDSEADAEYIVAKAIHDGVIDAAVDHEGKFVYSSENPDIYSTEEPLTAFNQRTHFCLEVHNEAVRGLRYPPNAHKPKHHTIDDNDDGDDLEELLSAIAEDAEQD